MVANSTVDIICKHALGDTPKVFPFVPLGFSMAALKNSFVTYRPPLKHDSTPNRLFEDENIKTNRQIWWC